MEASAENGKKLRQSGSKEGQKQNEKNFILLWSGNIKQRSNSLSCDEKKYDEGKKKGAMTSDLNPFSSSPANAQ